MGDQRPVWLLDIDGVLNAASRKPPGFVWPRDQWIQGRATAEGRSWPILAAQPVIDFIRTVHDKGRAEIRWHTTWQTEAQAVADLLGLPDFIVQDAPEYETYFRSRRPEWWKLPAARRVAAEGLRPSRRDSRALVWTDDDATGRDLPYAAADELRGMVPVLIVAPNPRLGLTPKHLREIDGFLSDHSE